MSNKSIEDASKELEALRKEANKSQRRVRIAAILCSIINSSINDIYH